MPSLIQRLVVTRRPSCLFLRRGFHLASLDEISEDAGYTKGAVYSNFRGKDDLFLALLAEHYERRALAHRQLLAELDLNDREATGRAIARVMLEAYEREPAWWPLVSDFSTHASRDSELRERLRELRETFLGAMAELVEVIAEHHGITYTMSAHEVARGAGALMRGLMLDWILELDDSGRATVFEERRSRRFSGG